MVPQDRHGRRWHHYRGRVPDDVPPTPPVPDSFDALDARARELDHAFRETDRASAFDLPDRTIYLDGNSLGALPRSVADRVDDVVRREWGQRLIRSWNEADWWDAPQRIGDRVGRLIGAAQGQVIVGDSTSVNLFKVLVAAARQRPDRRVVLTDPDSFPTDLYLLDEVAELLGLQVERVAPADAPRRLGELSGSVAVSAYSAVDYRTGQRWDLAAIAAATHAAGGLAVWDLCHGAGVLDLAVDTDGCDFAVGCGYKYLNGGPGAPAFAYVRLEHLESLANPLPGWQGHARPFAMSPQYTPARGIGRLRTGTQPIISLLALDAALDIYDGLLMAQVRARSLSLTGLAIDALDAVGLGGSVVTPREPERRGSQVSFRHDQALALVQALIARGVIGDFREPDIVRLGFAPLYLSHVEVVTAIRHLAQALAAGEPSRPEFARRATVT